MDLISADPELVLDDAVWPILTLGVDRPPARISGSAGIADALISPGCVIEGRVERSVLAPGVVVEEGATVRDSIVLHETVIGSGATVECSIVDAEVSVGQGARVGDEYAPEASGSRPSDSEIAVVAKGARIEEEARVAAGDRVESGATVGAK
jgi:glucose-1-phosphate adenylyltransferase